MVLDPHRDLWKDDDLRRLSLPLLPRSGGGGRRDLAVVAEDEVVRSRWCLERVEGDRPASELEGRLDVQALP